MLDRESPFKLIERRHMEAKLLARECELLALKIKDHVYEDMEAFKQDLETLHTKIQKLGDTL